MKNEILKLLKTKSNFYSSIIHGVKHWKTVESNGLYLADFKHGLRGSIFAQKHRDIIDLNDNQFQQLLKACEGHTTGERPDCITINTCWDADRLDIGRVGIQPRSQYLYTTEAKRIADYNDFGVLEKYNKNKERDDFV